MAEQARSTQQGAFTGRSDVTSASGVYDVALRYRFGDRESAVASPGRWSLIPYGGVRLMSAGLGVGAEILSHQTLQPLRQRRHDITALQLLFIEHGRPP